MHEINFHVERRLGRVVSYLARCGCGGPEAMTSRSAISLYMGGREKERKREGEGEHAHGLMGLFIWQKIGKEHVSLEEGRRLRTPPWAPGCCRLARFPYLIYKQIFHLKSQRNDWRNMIRIRIRSWCQTKYRQSLQTHPQVRKGTFKMLAQKPSCVYNHIYCTSSLCDQRHPAAFLLADF